MEGLISRQRGFLDALADLLIKSGSPRAKKAWRRGYDKLSNIFFVSAVGLFALAGWNRAFRSSGGMDGPGGTVVVVGLILAGLVVFGFIMGWALRKGWKAAGKG